MIQFQEENFGKGVKNPPFTRIPVSTKFKIKQPEVDVYRQTLLHNAFLQYSPNLRNKKGHFPSQIESYFDLTFLELNHELNFAFLI
jgi:hypothetical protein